jgi:methyl-accepting chemotaxis protein
MKVSLNISVRALLISAISLLSLASLSVTLILNMDAMKKVIFTQAEHELKNTARLAEVIVENAFIKAQEKVNQELNSADLMILRNSLIEIDPNQTKTVSVQDQIDKSISSFDLPRMSFNGVDTYLHFTEVDLIQSLSGSTVTIFQAIPQGLLRVSTNVMTLENKRAVGTYIPTTSLVYQTVKRGATYFGRAFVVNAWYLTAYKPFYDSNNEFAGVLYVGVPEEEVIQNIRDQLRQFEIFETGYIGIINKDGTYILSKNSLKDGENYWETLDPNGVPTIQLMLDRAKKLSQKESGIYNYLWKNNDDKDFNQRIAGITYFPDQEWTIFASALKSEVIKILSLVRITMFITMGIIMVVTIIISFLLANMLARPIIWVDKIISRMAGGDFTVSFDRTSVIKEIQHLSHAVDSQLKRNICQILSNVQTLSLESRERGDELGRLTRESSEATHETMDVMAQLVDSFKQLRDFILESEKSINDITAAVTKQEEVIEDQSASVVETSAAIEEMTASLENVARIARDKQSASDHLIDTTRQGSSKLKEMNQQLSGIIDNIDQMAEIIEMINSIASSTNLLAMNAAIEAAHAGEAGKGFAVVADEIRKLAESTAENSRIISTSLTSVMGQIKDMNELEKSLDNSVDEIDKEVNLFIQAFTEISHSTEELSNGAREIVSSMTLLQGVTHELKEVGAEVGRSSQSIKQKMSPLTGLTENNTRILTMVEGALKNVSRSQESISEISRKNQKTVESLHEKTEEFTI